MRESDIYAVGIMLYEMLTGSVPNQGEIPCRWLITITNDSAPLPSEVEPWIPRVMTTVASLAAGTPDASLLPLFQCL